MGSNILAANHKCSIVVTPEATIELEKAAIFVQREVAVAIARC